MRQIPHRHINGQGNIYLDELTIADKVAVIDVLADWIEYFLNDDEVIDSDMSRLSSAYCEIIKAVSGRGGHLTPEQWFGLDDVLEAEEMWEIKEKITLARRSSRS